MTSTTNLKKGDWIIERYEDRAVYLSEIQNKKRNKVSIHILLDITEPKKPTLPRPTFALMNGIIKGNTINYEGNTDADGGLFKFKKVTTQKERAKYLAMMI